MHRTRKLFFLILVGILIAKNLSSQVKAPAVTTAGDNIALSVSYQVLIGMNITTLSMSMVKGTAGSKLAPVTNNNLYVKISSLVPVFTYRRLTVRILSGSIPNGTTLSLYSNPCTTTNSGGKLGTAVSTPIVLSNVDQNIITNIGTCYTGSGSTDGYRMNFTWSVTTQASNYGQIVSGTYNPVVAFTITAPE